MAKEKKQSDSPQEPLTYFPPVVTVLGHVDHGKTSLLDAIRKSNIVKREHGGITQRIGASSIEIMHDGVKRKITFIDTPGHETFSKMRSRGAQVADIGLLIVSSGDGVMPQTKESITLLQESKLPFIVVLTKADLPDKIIEKVKQQLLRENVMIEGYGGNVPVIEVSARTGQNIKELLELILLVMEVQASERGKEKTPSETSNLEGIVIESKLDQKAGPRATIVIKNGTMTLREELLSEGATARVRTILSAEGKQLPSATIGDAVEVLGFEQVPPVGSIVTKKSEANATTQMIAKEEEKIITPMFHDQNKLSIIVAADTTGSLEAIVQALPKDITIATKRTGDITTADILMAKSIGAIIVGFNISIKPDVMLLARTEKILAKNYTIIYELLDELRDAAEGKVLSMQEEVFGQAKILASFPFEKTKVLGIQVTEGRVARGDKVRLMRGEEILGESTISSVRRGKDSTSKLEKGMEGGLIIHPYIDFTIGDMLICHG